MPDIPAIIHLKENAVFRYSLLLSFKESSGGLGASAPRGFSVLAGVWGRRPQGPWCVWGQKSRTLRLYRVRQTISSCCLCIDIKLFSCSVCSNFCGTRIRSRSRRCWHRQSDRIRSRIRKYWQRQRSFRIHPLRQLPPQATICFRSLPGLSNLHLHLYLHLHFCGSYNPCIITPVVDNFRINLYPVL